MNNLNNSTSLLQANNTTATTASNTSLSSLSSDKTNINTNNNNNNNINHNNSNNYYFKINKNLSSSVVEPSVASFASLNPDYNRNKLYNSITALEQNQQTPYYNKSFISINSLENTSAAASNVLNPNASSTSRKIKIKRRKNKSSQLNNTNSPKERGENAENDVLYEMIEKIQGKRFNNQRCEFNQDINVSY